MYITINISENFKTVCTHITTGYKHPQDYKIITNITLITLKWRSRSLSSGIVTRKSF